jgi:hypothetical protein
MNNKTTECSDLTYAKTDWKSIKQEKQTLIDQRQELDTKIKECTRRLVAHPYNNELKQKRLKKQQIIRLAWWRNALQNHKDLAKFESWIKDGKLTNLERPHYYKFRSNRVPWYIVRYHFDGILITYENDCECWSGVSKQGEEKISAVKFYESDLVLPEWAEFAKMIESAELWHPEDFWKGDTSDSFSEVSETEHLNK